MKFAQPTYLYLLTLLPLTLGLLLWGATARRRALSRIGDPEIVVRIATVRPGSRRVRAILWMLALSMLIVAIARPRWGSTITRKSEHGAQIMLVLDVSASMMAEDIKPSRLDRAKMISQELLDQLVGNEVGLVVFAGAAFVQFPLTNDLHTAMTFLSSANTATVSRSGTALEEALAVSWGGFVDERSGERVIVLLSDGEGHEGDPVALANAISDEEGTIHCLGLGTPQGEPVPVRDAQGQVIGYKKDAQGQTVLSRLDEGILQQIAAESGGIYARASATGDEISVIAGAINQLEGDAREGQFEVHGVERFEWFAGIALLLLLGEMAVNERRRYA